ncbi:MAG: OmpA family protein [Gemmatimonadales bacterium]|nr:OmpA family protein [Gemmatimonadales bacterium]
MTKHRVWQAVLGAAIVALPLQAQEHSTDINAGTWEFGAFGRWTSLDDGYNAPGIKDQVGIGGRVGVFFARNLQLEFSGSWTGTRTGQANDRSYYPFHGGFTWHKPFAKQFAFLLGARGTAQLMRGDSLAPRRTDYGVGALAGFRIDVDQQAALRLEATYDYLFDPGFKNFGVQFGLSWYPGRKGGSAPAPAPAPVAPAPRPAPAVAAPPPPADSDKDGVIDSADGCPNTPAGEPVDANGCSGSQKDDDRDGVMNNADRCRNTPAGEAVDATGCSASQRDGDNDGVKDNADKCPATPAGEAVDADGCGASQKDSDNDGVKDNADKCPASPAGERVDATGCKPVFEEGRRSLVLKGVNFESGKAVLLAGSTAALDEVAASLKDHPEVSVEVGGYTDNRGAARANTALSQRRAQAVVDYLVGKGVPAGQLTAKGYGPANPVAPNTTAEGRAENRRVELKQTN